jgi:hypothetical protein
MADIPYTMRCAKCQKIPLKLFLGVYKFKHSESYNDLRQSAADGCDLCELLAQYIDRTLEGRTGEYGDFVRKLDSGIFLEHVVHRTGIRIMRVNWGRKDSGFPELIFHSPQLSDNGKI